MLNKNEDANESSKVSQGKTTEGAAVDESEDTEEIAPVSAPDKWDYETDILIVGGGGAGLCASAAALRNGARVLVLEKQAETGGHSQHAGGAATFNTAAAKRKRLSADRAKAFKHSYVVQSNATIDPCLLATLIDRAHEVYDWSESQSWGRRWEALNIGFVPAQGVVRMLVKGTFENILFSSGTELVAPMYPWMQWLKNYVTENGGKILVNTKALALVKTDDRIVGVKGMTADDKTVFAKANKAVILAGSGFTNNREMIKKYCPDIYDKAVGTFLPPSDTGEVVRMALGAGADLAGKNSWVAFAGGIPFFDKKYTGKPNPGPWFQYLRQGWLQLARGAGWLEVNAGCEEYIPITARLDWEMHPKASASLTGSAAYVIFDADYPTTIWETLPPPMLDDRPMTAQDPEYPWFDKFKEFMPKDWLDSIKQAIEYGGIKSSDTIEGLAKELGLDPAKLANRVKAWNAKAAAGKVDEFGRLPQNMKPIVKAPFYGIKTGAIIGGIYCGPRVNYKFEVLDKNLNPIPGLYAAGSTAGGTSGEGVFQAASLSSLGLAFSSGWIAGDNATATKSTYEPTGMFLESDIRMQELFNKFNRYFPRMSALLMKRGFSKKKRKKKT